MRVKLHSRSNLFYNCGWVKLRAVPERMIYRIESILVSTTIICSIAWHILPASCQSSEKADDMSNGVQFQLKAPINATTPAVKESNPGSDNYRRTRAFPTSVEKNLIDSEEAVKPHVIDRLKGMVGTYAQMKIHAGHDITVGQLHGIMIEVENDTDRPLLFDGDLATATSGDKRLKAATLATVDNVANPRKSKTERFMRDVVVCSEAAATLGAVPAVKDSIMQAGPIPQRYGADEARRINELSRFGKRVLWPGDTTTGFIYFKTADPLKGFVIELPVSSTIDATDHGSLTTVR
jgi:hypothetical protein